MASSLAFFFCVHRNAQIADLQQKVLVADSEGRLKQRIDGITSIVDAKCAVRVLMAEVRKLTAVLYYYIQTYVELIMVQLFRAICIYKETYFPFFFFLSWCLLKRLVPSWRVSSNRRKGMDKI